MSRRNPQAFFFFILVYYVSNGIVGGAAAHYYCLGSWRGGAPSVRVAVFPPTGHRRALLSLMCSAFSVSVCEFLLRRRSASFVFLEQALYCNLLFSCLLSFCCVCSSRSRPFSSPWGTRPLSLFLWLPVRRRWLKYLSFLFYGFGGLLHNEVRRCATKTHSNEGHDAIATHWVCFVSCTHISLSALFVPGRNARPMCICKPL